MTLFELIPEFDIPDIKPAIELIRGNLVQKMSGKSRHAVTHGAAGATLLTWSEGRGSAGVNWTCYLLPAGEEPSALVPDVAYISNERLAPLTGEEQEYVQFAPDIAIEILCPEDILPLLETKIGLYLGNGGSLVIVIDPERRTIRTIDADADRTFVEPAVARSNAFPDLTIDVAAFFAGIH